MSTRKLARSKHSGVLAAFRQHFIKTGLIDSRLSEIYGQVMEDRHESDYELIAGFSPEDARQDLISAQRFVEQVEAWLKKEDWL